MTALPAFRAVAKDGRFYSEVDPVQLHTPEKQWMKPMIEAALAEMQPGPDRTETKIKNKLIDVFNRHNGQIILCQGTTGLAVYAGTVKNGLSDPSIKSLENSTLGRMLLWCMHRYIRHRCSKILPDARATFCKLDNNDQSSDDHQYEIALSKHYIETKYSVMHELTHSAVQAGVDLVDQDYKDCEKYRMTAAPGWSVLPFIHASLNGPSGISMYHDTVEKFYKKEKHNEEYLTMSAQLYFNGHRDGFFQAPIIYGFIEKILDYDLDLLLANDADGHIALVNALSTDNDYMSALHEVVAKIIEIRNAYPDSISKDKALKSFAPGAEQKILAAMDSTLANLRTPALHP